MMPYRDDYEDSMTVLEAVRCSLAQASRFNPDDVVAPAAVLWTDDSAQWKDLVAQLRMSMPYLLTLGEYDPDQRIGPAIWLRCVIDRTVPGLDDDSIPVIYLPHVSRQTLRAVKECPEGLRPLVELQYRGVVWSQSSGKDWTVEAFLVSEDGGLALDLARDKHTRAAMLRSLARLSETPITQLRGRRLEAEEFDRLLVPDAAKNLLQWLGDPRKSKEEWDTNQWGAFCSRCRQDYDFDPEGDGETVGGERLGKRNGPLWRELWNRYAESPQLYPGIPDLLDRAQPQQIGFERETWPRENTQEEKVLRQELMDLEDVAAKAARKRITELEQTHSARRDWVWAALGRSPLALALEHLAVLAEGTSQNLGGNSLQNVAQSYCESGWEVDGAALRALACVQDYSDDLKAVEAVVRSMYLPWLENAASHFQTLVARDGLPCSPSEVMTGECILFVDGLRFDISQRLQSIDGAEDLEISAQWRWAALPSVTATGKPAVSPVADQLSGSTPGELFAPEVQEGSLNADRFRRLIEDEGYQYIDSVNTGSPQGDHIGAWTEYGEFDSLGHHLQSRICARIDEQLDLLLQRIRNLLTAGWVQVHLVTDHGWLVMPGGLPKTELPQYLTESRWARCASVRANVEVGLPTYGWYWNPTQRVASAPGVRCFVHGHEYAHGGVSVQECLIPDVVISLKGASRRAVVSIDEIRWAGLRCRVTVQGDTNGLTADLRTRPADPSSSITFSREIDSQGKAALLVEDDSLAGLTVSVVIADDSHVLTKQATTVGGED